MQVVESAIWRQDVVLLSWSSAEGLYSLHPKRGMIRPISLLNAEGKIMFRILVEIISSFVLENGFVNTSVQKAEIPGFPTRKCSCSVIVKKYNGLF